MSARYILAVADATELAKVLNKLLPGQLGIAFQRDNNTLQLLDPDGTAGVFTPIPIGITVTAALLNAFVGGVAAGYRVARGVHTQVAASDTVATGLATVVAVVVSPKTRTVKQLFFNGDIGDQAGTPAAGSVLITSQKPTAVNDVTPTAATDFTDNIAVHWVAIGT